MQQLHLHHTWYRSRGPESHFRKLLARLLHSRLEMTV